MRLNESQKESESKQKTYITDESFKKEALDILFNLIKLLVLKQRIYFAWVDSGRVLFYSEFLQRSHALQSKEMGATVTGMRLSGLKFDLARMKAANEEIVFQEETEWQMGGLAITEFETKAAWFDLSGTKEIMGLLNRQGLAKFQHALEFQLVERAWFVAAIEVQALISESIYRKKIAVAALVKSNNQIMLATPGHKETANESIISEKYELTDLSAFILNILTKKIQIRKVILSRYADEQRILNMLDSSEEDKAVALLDLKRKLLNWYILNLAEMAAFENERAEFAQIIAQIKNQCHKSSHGKLIFAFSKGAEDLESIYDFDFREFAVSADFHTRNDISRHNCISNRTFS